MAEADKSQVMSSTGTEGTGVKAVATDSVKLEPKSGFKGGDSERTSEDVSMTNDEHTAEHIENDDVKTEPSDSQMESQTADTSMDKSGEDGQEKAGTSREDEADKDRDDESQAKSKREKQEEERLKMQVLVSHFSEEQLNRYEIFRRAAFPKAAIRRLMQSITASTISQNVIIAMSGIAKVFVGEVVETALDIKEKWNDTGALQPKHLREAVRIMKRKGALPNTKYKKKLFR